MSQLSRKEYLAKMRWRYAGRGSEGRSRLLDEVCEVCGYERKHAIKLMNRRQPAPKRKAGRKRVYAQEVTAVVKSIWLHSEQPCGKRLKELLPHYQRWEGRLGKDVRQQVLKARQVRIQFPGAVYHVMARWDRREAIFRDDADREMFLAALAEACGRTGWRAAQKLRR